MRMQNWFHNFYSLFSFKVFLNETTESDLAGKHVPQAHRSETCCVHLPMSTCRIFKEVELFLKPVKNCAYYHIIVLIIQLRRTEENKQETE